MAITTDLKSTIMEKAAAFYEQELLNALNTSQLTRSKEAVKTCFEKCYDEGKSFSREFRELEFDDKWREDLKPVAVKATERLQEWMTEHNLQNNVSLVVKYDHVDEKGRAYRPVPLASLDAPGHFFKIEHKPSFFDDPSRKAWLLVPLFGWEYDEETMQTLIEEDRIAYGDLPWDTAYRKNFLG